MIATVRAPGRVNLIGDHTDYNEGFVLPVAIDRECKVTVRATGGAGLALMGVGFLVFTALDTDSTYWLFGTGAVITGVGLALATAPATTAIVSSLPAHRQGIASALLHRLGLR